jgi:ABC-type amino acid transport substrate-binding protein
MDFQSIFQRIPTKARNGAYLTLATVALILTALKAGDVDALWGFSTIRALAVIGVLATPFGFTAAANVNVAESATESGPGMAAGVDPEQPTDVE